MYLYFVFTNLHRFDHEVNADGGTLSRGEYALKVLKLSLQSQGSFIREYSLKKKKMIKQTQEIFPTGS